MPPDSRSCRRIAGRSILPGPWKQNRRGKTAGEKTRKKIEMQYAVNERASKTGRTGPCRPPQRLAGAVAAAVKKPGLLVPRAPSDRGPDAGAINDDRGGHRNPKQGQRHVHKLYVHGITLSQRHRIATYLSHNRHISPSTPQIYAFLAFHCGKNLLGMACFLPGAGRGMASAAARLRRFLAGVFLPGRVHPDGFTFGDEQRHHDFQAGFEPGFLPVRIGGRPAPAEPFPPP